MEKEEKRWGYEKLLKITQYEKCNEASPGTVKRETGHEEMCDDGVVGMRLPLYHPFTVINVKT